MSDKAVGLEQVGGVTHAAKGMVDNADGRVQAAKTLNAISEASHGRMVGPAGDLMRSGMSGHAAAAGASGVKAGEVAANFARGEKTVVRGVEDSAQVEKVTADEAETTYSALNRTIEG
jgi:hypothetical protein